MSEVENREKTVKSNGERCISAAEAGVTKEKSAGFE